MFAFVENFVLHSLMGSLIGSGCTDCTGVYYTVHCSGYIALFSAIFCTVQFTQFKRGLNMFVSLGKHILFPQNNSYYSPISSNDVTFILVHQLLFPPSDL